MRKFICDFCGNEGTSEGLTTGIKPEGWSALTVSGYLPDEYSTRVRQSKTVDACNVCTHKLIPVKEKSTDYKETFIRVIEAFIDEKVNEAVDNIE
jgi:hypothetical protein